MPDEKPKILRTIQKDYENGVFIRLTDQGDGKYIHIECQLPSGKRGFKCGLVDLLDMFVALWPDEIAYQFKNEEDAEQQ